jgi:hypothetical protein
MLLEEQFTKSWPDLAKALAELDTADVTARLVVRLADTQPKLWKVLEHFKCKTVFTAKHLLQEPTCEILRRRLSRFEPTRGVF